MSSPLGLYRPGRSLLHRTGAPTKLLGLLGLGLVLAVLPGPWPGPVALGLLLLALARAQVAWRSTLRSLRGLLLLALLLGGWLTWQQGWSAAVASVGTLLALLAAATLLTTTTPTEEVLRVLTEAMAPLRRLGVDPELVGLAMSLVLRGVPQTLELAQQTREAAAARGLERDLRARLVPLVLRVVSRARATGEALAARGFGD